VSVPVPGGRSGSPLVRDDTLSVRGLVPVPGLRECRSLLIVSFPLDLASPGCAAAAGLAACNTNCPWRRVPPAGTVVP
jgi:hypothetical protein